MNLRTLARLAPLLLLSAAAGCERADHPGSASSHSAQESQAETSSVPTPGHGTHGDPMEHGVEDSEALPLLPIMLRMSADMAGVMQALWLEDYEAMARSAAAVAGHAHISAAELKRIDAELGPELTAFEAADAAVHEASVRMRDAAEARQLDAFLEHLATVQRGCVACHSKFRDRLSTTSR